MTDIYYIEFLDSKNRFQKTKKEFKNYDAALEWGAKNISNFNVDMIRIK